jgi:hypothetical protein
MNAQSLKEYSKVVRAVQVFITVMPLGGRLLQKQSALAFPPLGANTDTAVFFVIILSGVAAILPWPLTFRKSKIPLLCGCALLLIVSVVMYVQYSQRYVVCVPTPDKGNLCASVGYVRTPFANDIAGQIALRDKRNVPDVTDADLLTEHGSYENVVKSFWTQDSISWVRLCLFGSYLGAFMLLNFFVGLVAKNER